MASTRRSSSEPQKTLLTVDQMERGAARTQKRIEDLETFDLASISQRWDPKTKAMETAIEETLAAVFGHNIVEYRRYERAAQDYNGTIMSLGSLAGRIIQTNNRGFVEPGDPRSEARWKGAITELQQRDLIEDRATRERLFSLLIGVTASRITSGSSERTLVNALGRLR
jgi:hypothetical protein